jgi:hypothetical protein
MRHATVSLAIAVGWFVGGAAVADPVRDADAKRADARRSLREPTGSDAAGCAVARYVSALDVDGLRRLTEDRDPSLAMFAAWALRRHELPDLDGPPHPELFLRLVEKRCGVAAPPGWRALASMVYAAGAEQSAAWQGESLLQPYIDSGACEATYFRFTDQGQVNLTRVLTLPVVRYAATETDFDAPVGTTLVARGSEIEIGLGWWDGATIPASLLALEPTPAEEHRSPTSRPERCNALLATDQIILATHDDWGGRFPIACIDRHDGRVRWKADVWGVRADSGPPPIYSGQAPTHNVWLEANERAVVVFGADYGNVCYAEGFDRETGEVLFRFATGYWGHEVSPPDERRGEE